MKIKTIFLLIIILICFTACKYKQTDDSRLKIIKFQSIVLKKEMSINVYLPKDYNTGIRYPVLYFLPDYGGSDYTVMNEYEIRDKSDKLVDNKKIKPLVIVGVKMDRSFGLNTASGTERFETSSGKAFDKGMYEDYFMNDVIPLIDNKYNTIASSQGRYIGGYSMGGYAALHIAFNHADMFSKVGGHSPSLFLEDFPDKTVSDWLYPDKKIREERDPIYIAQKNDLSGLSVYIDTGETDVNIEGCSKLYEILKENKVNCVFNLFSGVHSRGYCYDNMDKYLIFYASE